jgi:hypothetical protein
VEERVDGWIQKLSVEETASILVGLSLSGYILKNNWRTTPNHSYFHLEAYGLLATPNVL